MHTVMKNLVVAALVGASAPVAAVAEGVAMKTGEVRMVVTSADDEALAKVEGLPSRAVRALALVPGGAVIRGFVAPGDGSAGLRLSLATVEAAVPPPGAPVCRTESGRLRPWAHGLLLDRAAGAEPLRVGGPLEPFLFRLGEEGRRVVALRGFEQDGVFCAVAVDLQPPAA